MYKKFLYAVWMTLWLPMAQAATPPTMTDHHAEEAQSRPRYDDHLSLADAVASALALAPGREVPVARQDEADALKARAGSLISDVPELSLRHHTDGLNGNRGLREWEGGVNLPLWRLGERAAAARVAEDAYGQASTENGHLRWQFAGEVREALWTVKLADARVDLATRARDSARSLLTDAEARIRAGELAARERLGARTILLERENERERAAVDLADAMVRWRVLTGLDKLPGKSVETQVAPTPEERDTPELQNARSTLARYNDERDLTRKGGAGAPRLLVTARSETDIFGVNADALGLQLSLPFGGKAQRGVKLAQAQLNVARAQRDVEDLGRMQELARHEASHELHAAKVALANADERRTLASDEHGLAVKAFRVGEMDLAERLIIEARAQQAQADATLRRLEMERAIARYNQISGILP